MLKLQVRVTPVGGPTSRNPPTSLSEAASLNFLEICPADVSLEQLCRRICARHDRNYPHLPSLDIKKLQTHDDLDLDLEFAVGDVFNDKDSSNPLSSIVRVIQAPNNRDSSIPPQSALRPLIAAPHLRKRSLGRSRLGQLSNVNEEESDEGLAQNGYRRKRQRVDDVLGDRLFAPPDPDIPIFSRESLASTALDASNQSVQDHTASPRRLVENSQRSPEPLLTHGRTSGSPVIVASVEPRISGQTATIGYPNPMVTAGDDGEKDPLIRGSSRDPSSTKSESPDRRMELHSIPRSAVASPDRADAGTSKASRSSRTRSSILVSSSPSVEQSYPSPHLAASNKPVPRSRSRETIEPHPELLETPSLTNGLARPDPARFKTAKAKGYGVSPRSSVATARVRSLYDTIETDDDTPQIVSVAKRQDGSDEAPPMTSVGRRARSNQPRSKWLKSALKPSVQSVSSPIKSPVEDPGPLDGAPSWVFPDDTTTASVLHINGQDVNQKALEEELRRIEAEEMKAAREDEELRDERRRRRLTEEPALEENKLHSKGPADQKARGKHTKGGTENGAATAYEEKEATEAPRRSSQSNDVKIADAVEHRSIDEGPRRQEMKVGRADSAKANTPTRKAIDTSGCSKHARAKPKAKPILDKPSGVNNSSDEAIIIDEVLGESNHSPPSRRSGVNRINSAPRVASNSSANESLHDLPSPERVSMKKPVVEVVMPILKPSVVGHVGDIQTPPVSLRRSTSRVSFADDTNAPPAAKSRPSLARPATPHMITKAKAASTRKSPSQGQVRSSTVKSGKRSRDCEAGAKTETAPLGTRKTPIFPPGMGPQDLELIAGMSSSSKDAAARSDLTSTAPADKEIQAPPTTASDLADKAEVNGHLSPPKDLPEDKIVISSDEDKSISSYYSSEEDDKGEETEAMTTSHSAAQGTHGPGGLRKVAAPAAVLGSKEGDTASKDLRGAERCVEILNNAAQAVFPTEVGEAIPIDSPPRDHALSPTRSLTRSPARYLSRSPSLSDADSRGRSPSHSSGSPASYGSKPSAESTEESRSEEDVDEIDGLATEDDDQSTTSDAQSRMSSPGSSPPMPPDYYPNLSISNLKSDDLDSYLQRAASESTDTPRQKAPGTTARPHLSSQAQSQPHLPSASAMSVSRFPTLSTLRKNRSGLAMQNGSPATKTSSSQPFDSPLTAKRRTPGSRVTFRALEKADEPTDSEASKEGEEEEDDDDDESESDADGANPQPDKTATPSHPRQMPLSSSQSRGKVASQFSNLLNSMLPSFFSSSPSH
ncbi:MAG: hypothetical protein M1817_001757 [Caeruleum heppii]|nr:MAG: hypothetical protein M1817_001757 [Caeruleum heppii]